jgi:hypothetical protein
LDLALEIGVAQQTLADWVEDLAALLKRDPVLGDGLLGEDADAGKEFLDR